MLGNGFLQRWELCTKRQKSVSPCTTVCLSMKEAMQQPEGFPGGSVVKNPPATAVDSGSIPSWGRAPAEGNGNPLKYSCLENPMEGGPVEWEYRCDH